MTITEQAVEQTFDAIQQYTDAIAAIATTLPPHQAHVLLQQLTLLIGSFQKFLQFLDTELPEMRI